MTLSFKRFVLLGLMIVGAFAATASAAQADIAPASTAFTGSASDTVYAYSGTNITCTTAFITGRTPARGTSSLSVNLTFGAGGRCTAFGFTATVVCSDFATLRITDFTAGTRRADGTVALDSGFNCTIAILGCTVTVSGSQLSAGTFTYDNATGILHPFVVAVGRDSGGVCSGNTTRRTGGGVGTFSGTYSISPRLTIS